MSKLPLAVMPLVRSRTAALSPLVLMLACGFSCENVPARAADYTWSGGSSTLWTTTGNWNPGGTPGAADTATFNSAGNGNTTLDLSGTASLFGLFFDTSSAAGYTIGSGGVNAQRLQLANSGSVSMTSTVTTNQNVNAVLALGTNASAGSYTLQNDSLTNTLTVSGSVLGGTGGTAGVKTLTLAGAGNTTISGVIAHGGASSVALTKSGAGTVTLTGANTYTGTTTISSGSLQIGDGGTAGSLSTSSTISVASGAAIVFNRSDTYGNLNAQTFGAVSGAGSIVLQAGTLFIGTNSSLTGGIVVNGGQLDIGTATPMGAAGLFTINGGILNPRLASRVVANSGAITNDFTLGASGNANALTLSGSFDLTGGTRTVTAAGSTVTLSGNLYNGGLTKTGTGTLTLTGTNTYTGTTSVLAGTLQVGSNGATGSISSSSVLVLGGGGLTLNRSDAATQAFASTTLAPGVSSVSANATNTVDFGAITRQPGATLNIAQTGTFITSSANTNGILGGGILYNNAAFAVANGASAITGLSTFVNSSTAGNTPASYANANINLDSSQSPTGAITPNSLRTGQGPTLTLANTLNTIQSGGILVVNTNANPVVITGGTLTGPSGGDLVVTTFKTTSTSVSINSVIVDNGGPLGFTAAGTGRVSLGGANTYSGTTSLNGARLEVRNTSALGTGPVIVRAASWLTTAVTGTIANPIQVNATLTLNPSGSSSTLSGVISGSGLLSIPSTNVSGTIALAGNNTFTGNIQFVADGANAGPTVLVATRSTSFGVGTKTISLNGIANSRNRTVALDGSGGDFTLGSNISYTLSNDGSQGSPAVLNIAGNNTISGAISMTTGGGNTLVQSDAGLLTLAGTITSVDGLRTLVLGGAAGGTVSGAVTDNGANTAGITKQGAGRWLISGTNTYTGTTAINAGTLQFQSPAALYNGGTSNWTAAQLPVASGATLAVSVGPSNFTTGNVTTLLTNLGGLGGAVNDNGLRAGSSIGFDTSNAGGSFTIADEIKDSTGTGGGAIGLGKLGAGTLVLSGSNTYSGATSVSTGTLQVGGGSTTGSIVSSVSVSSGATLAFNRSDALTYGGTVSGSGGLTKLGAGGLTLSAANTYTGATTISSGTLFTGIANAISGSSAITIGSAAGRGFLEIDHPLSISSLTFTGFGGDIVNGSSGTATFTATSGTATITVLSGSNSFHANASLSSPTVVNVSDNAFFSFHKNLAGGASLTKSGAGLVTIAGSNGSFQGPTTISAGTLAAATSTALGTGTVSIGSGGSLRLDPGAILANAITTTSTGSILFAGGGLQRTSNQSLSTVAQLVAGGTGASVALDPAFAWSGRIAGVTYSDVLDLTNTHGTIQILQMTYDDSLLGGGSESDILLGWNSGGTWVNAIDGNIGSSGGSAQANAFGSYTALGILPTAAYLGSWGRDMTTNTVWAVVNHNSEYAASIIVVPEPGTLALAGFGVTIVGWAAARRRRS